MVLGCRPNRGARGGPDPPLSLITGVRQLDKAPIGPWFSQCKTLIGKFHGVTSASSIQRPGTTAIDAPFSDFLRVTLQSGLVVNKSPFHTTERPSKTDGTSRDQETSHYSIDFDDLAFPLAVDYLRKRRT